MGRIVVNKHYDSASGISVSAFTSVDNNLAKGEIVICNEAGKESIYILNTNGEAKPISGQIVVSGGTIEVPTAASGITFDNEGSNLTATTVQEALKELGNRSGATVITSGGVIDVYSKTEVDEKLDVLSGVTKENSDNIAALYTKEEVDNMVASAVTALESRIEELLTAMPKHVFMTKEEYMELGDDVEEDTIYLIYQGNSPVDTGDTGSTGEDIEITVNEDNVLIIGGGEVNGEYVYVAPSESTVDENGVLILRGTTGGNTGGTNTGGTIEEGDIIVEDENLNINDEIIDPEALEDNILSFASPESVVTEDGVFYPLG